MVLGFCVRSCMATICWVVTPFSRCCSAAIYLTTRAKPRPNSFVVKTQDSFRRVGSAIHRRETTLSPVGELTRSGPISENWDTFCGIAKSCHQVVAWDGRSLLDQNRAEFTSRIERFTGQQRQRICGKPQAFAPFESTVGNRPTADSFSDLCRR